MKEVIFHYQPDNISGILNWCIEGLKLFYKEGAIPPQTVTKETEEYRQNSDKLGSFMLECLDKKDRVIIKAKDLYEIYDKWCEDNGYGTENKGNFFAELKTKNIFKVSATINGATVRNVVVGYTIKHEILSQFKNK